MKRFVKAMALVIALLCVFTAFVACTAEQGDNEKNNSADVEFYITYKGVKVELDKKADSVISDLGTPKKTESLGTCSGRGAEIKYVYDDIVIHTLKSDNDETIDQISFTNDIAETKKGICIGDSSDKVIKAYGDPAEKTDSLIIYTKALDGFKLYLKFSIENGEVDKINFIRLFDVEE